MGDVVKLYNEVDDNGEYLHAVLVDDDEEAFSIFSLSNPRTFLTGDGDFVCICNSMSADIPNCMDVLLDIRWTRG